MAAARVWPARVIASDIDPLAARTARANAAANRLGARVVCLAAPGFAHPLLHARAPYDLVLANILAGPLRRLAPQVAAHTARGSVLVLAGLLTRQAPAVLAVYRGFVFRRRRQLRLGAWSTLVLQRGG
jgi:ribosomal protein L11 methyltransferase